MLCEQPDHNLLFRWFLDMNADEPAFDRCSFKRATSSAAWHTAAWTGGSGCRSEDDRIACADFTVADIMMASVLRGIRKTDLMEPFPRIKAYYRRCHDRPAWQRTLGLYAERVGVSVDDIR